MATQKKGEESKRLFEAITQNTPDLIFGFDLNYRFTYANEALLKMLGRTWDEAIGKDMLELGYEPWHADMHIKEIDEVIKTKKNLRREFSFPHPTLNKLIYDYIFIPVLDQDGKVEAIAGTARDITEIRNVEENLKESEERFRIFGNNIQNLAWIAEGDGNIFWYNQRWLDYTGLTLDEMQGWGWQKVHHPDHVERILEISKKLWITNEPFELTFPLKRADGEYRWFLTRGVPILDENGKICRWIGTNTDIHNLILAEEKLKQSEQQYEHLIRSSPSAIGILHGEDLIITIANDAIIEIWGKGKEIVGKKYFEAMPELVEQDYKEVFANVYKKGIPFNAIETPVTLIQNGETTLKYYNFTLYPQRNIYNEVNGIGIIATEVTSQALLNKRIKESEKRFQLLVSDATTGIVVLTGPEMRVEVVNEAYGRLIDLKPNDLLGKPLFSIIPSAEEYYLPLLENVRQTGEMLQLYDSQYTVTVNGKLIEGFLHVVYQPYRDTDGNILGVMAIFQDVTEAVLARKKVEQSEKKFEAAILAVDGIIWTNNSAGEMTGEQPGWANLTGQRFEEYQVYGWAKSIHPDDAQPTVEAWKKAVAHKSTFEFEHRLKTKQNVWRLFSVRAVPIFDKNGDIEQWVGVHTDITEQKEIEKKLAYRTALLEAHTEANLDGVLLVDAKGKIISFNQRFVEIWNMPLHIVNANDDEAALSFAMTQLVNPQQFIDKVKYLYEHPTETSLDELEFKDGKIVERHGYPVIGKDSIYYAWSWTFKDITTQKNYEKTIIQSEERFRSLAQTLPQLVWVTDAQGNAEFASFRWKEYTGIEPGGEKEWRTIVHPDDYDNINAAWVHSLTTGNLYNADVRLKSKNGEYRWYTVKGEPVFDNENKIVKWVGAFTDTHSEKLFTQELELKVKERTNELEQFNIELERKNKELESFTYISSHDLQEPLRKIQIFASRILEKDHNSLSEYGKDNFKRMQEAAKRMQILIQDLLVYSRTNKAERKFEITDLNKIIDEVKEDLSEELEDKHATIEATELGDANIIPFQFRQLMHNLIGNSLKFSTPDNPPHIKIKSETANGINLQNPHLSPQKKYCHISISDNGIGFESQYSEKIFEVFQRLHGKNEYNGTGIGLSIVKKIVENHEGLITATSELNKGATFDIYIPAT